MMTKDQRANVKAKVYLNGIPFAAPVYTSETNMSADLPADNLGELVAQAVEGAWKAGHDPLNFTVVVEFY